MDSILIIDDEPQIRKLLSRMMELEGYEVFQAADCQSTLKQLKLHNPQVVLCDVFLPDGNGVDMVTTIKKLYPELEVILLTAHGNIPDGVQAIKNGAFDYITKGDDNNKIIPLISRAMAQAKKNVGEKVKTEETQSFSFDAIKGKSEGMQQAVALARKVSATDVTVLLTGETGTGKEVFAQAIHRNSLRKENAFVAVNCSAFSKDLLESEIFGHKAGSFTGAMKDKKGLFEVADNGTIFLDEIGEMAFELQAKLLRVLEAGEYIKIGDTKPTKVNVRVISATNRDLKKEIEQGNEVSEDYHTIQSYVPHTNILSTTFVSEQDEFAVVDFMPCYELYDNKEYYRPAEVYRYIHWIKGRPRIKVNYHPAPDYARGKAFFNVTSRYIETYSSSNNKDRQYLYSSLPLQGIVDHQEFILEQDEFFLLSYNEKVIPVDIEREKLEYCRTLVYWLNWTDRTRKFTIYNDIIERSLLTLKMMSFYNGAVLASLTTSLPEAVGEVRNWDYRFCWLRDASMSIETLFKIGHADAARKFMKFIQSTFVAEHDTYQIMYGIRGERKLTEVILDHLSGYKNSQPVRIGNDAYHQRQNDSFGYLMDLIYQYYRLMPGTLDEIEDMWEMVKSIMTTVMEDWRKPDKGIWEIRGEGQHFVSSKVMCWVALDRGARIARILNKYENSRRWEEEADAIKADVMRNGWKEEIQSFSQAYGNLDLDSSLLLMEPYGFIDADDIRYHKTVKAVKQSLLHKGLMYRYNTHDDFGCPSSAFTICTFWLIRALYVIGEKDEARCLFDEILQYSNHLGLFSEDIDFETKEQLGNFPQAYSHLALVNTAVLFAEEDKRLIFK